MADKMENLVIKVQRTLDAVYGYGVSTDHGSFGYQATQGSVVFGLKARNAALEEMASAIHEGWALIARYFEDPIYASKPEKREMRLKLADTPYSALPEEEKIKDRLVALAIKGGL